MKNHPHIAHSAFTEIALAIASIFTSANAQTQPAATSTMPDEAGLHEGTWLQWPHQYTYGLAYRNSLDATWVAMTKALGGSETVHIIAYNGTEKTRISDLLKKARIPLTQVTFHLQRTDDVWVRDNGPLFVRDTAGKLTVTDWGFNGWGFDTRYRNDDTVPSAVADWLRLPKVDVNDIILEGGAFVMDGKGTLLATRSSILEPDRNPFLTQDQLEQKLRALLGAKKFIWLDGAPGGQDDITDSHIDGFATFAPGRRLVTLSDTDLAYWGVKADDIKVLNRATDFSGTPYTKTILPLTAINVSTTSGRSVGFKGSYVNYYVANTVVLIPAYSDPNDKVAQNILQTLYPGRTVVPIDVRNLYANGGIIHCVTQQQPQ